MTKIAKKIKDLRASLNLTQLELGEKVGVPQATVSKWENEKQEPDKENNLKLAHLATVDIHDWMDMPELGRSTVRSMRAPLVGVLQAGNWREAVAYPESEWRSVDAPLPSSFDGIPTRSMEVQAFEVEGPSMNLVYPQGTLVYAASVMSYRQPMDGDRVIVVRTSKLGLVEVTLKEYVVGEDGRKWLMPKSTDPEHQTPLPFVEGSDGDEVRIAGIVLGAVVLERNRRLPPVSRPAPQPAKGRKRR